MAKDNNVVLEGVRLVFRNFAGKKGTYNAEGDRNFAVILDPEVASGMAKDGWNIKYLKPREDDEEQIETPYLKVKINFNGRPPKLVMLTSRGRTFLDEDTCEMLDWADMRNVDLLVSPYDYDVNGNQGRSAYLQSIFVTIEEDELELKYADVQDATVGVE